MKRSDGVLLKSLDPFTKIIPYVMDKRTESQNFSKQVIITDGIDSYISEKGKQGYRFSYLHVFIAAYVRLFAERPNLNRFIVNSKIYERNNISISMVIKHSLRDDAEETTVKFEFTGKENIFEVAEIIDRVIAEAKTNKSDTDVDKLVVMVMSLPGFVKKALVRILKGMDKLNLLPKSVIKASPFHSTLFFTYLKSIKTDYVYHHLTEFGTTGFFAALGKADKMPMVVGGQLVIKKCCKVGYTIDDRVCDGLYLANSFKLLEKYLKNPYLLEGGKEDEDSIKSQTA